MLTRALLTGLWPFLSGMERLCGAFLNSFSSAMVTSLFSGILDVISNTTRWRVVSEYTNSPEMSGIDESDLLQTIGYLHFAYWKFIFENSSINC